MPGRAMQLPFNPDDQERDSQVKVYSLSLLAA
jgi:hypothetical protein